MQQRFLLQILLLAQHVSATTMPIIRSSRVLYSCCCLWYFVLWFSSCWSGGAEVYVSGLQDACWLEFYFHMLTTMDGQNHIKPLLLFLLYHIYIYLHSCLRKNIKIYSDCTWIPTELLRSKLISH